MLYELYLKKKKDKILLADLESKQPGGNRTQEEQ